MLSEGLISSRVKFEVVDVSIRLLDITDVVSEDSNSVLFLGNSGLQSPPS
jgi:hypothetical protein